MSVYTDVARYRELYANLFRRDLQAKYRGSALGILWTIANPVLLMGIYLLVFSVVFKTPFSKVDHYPLFLLVGLAIWTFFATALQSATRSMLDNANLIRKTRFPRQLVPLSVVGAHLVSFLVMLVILLALNFALLPRVRATEWLAIPLAACLVAIVGGLAIAAVGWTMWAVAPRQMEQCPLPSSPLALSTCAANEVQARRKTIESASAKHLNSFPLGMACTCISKD